MLPMCNLLKALESGGGAAAAGFAWVDKAAAFGCRRWRQAEEESSAPGVHKPHLAMFFQPKAPAAEAQPSLPQRQQKPLRLGPWATRPLFCGSEERWICLRAQDVRRIVCAGCRDVPALLKLTSPNESDEARDDRKELHGGGRGGRGGGV
jgi:hypothetical protein